MSKKGKKNSNVSYSSSRKFSSFSEIRSFVAPYLNRDYNSDINFKIEKYSENLAYLEASKIALTNIFSIPATSSKKTSNPSKLSSEIKKFFAAKAGILGGVVATGISLGLLATKAGGIPEVFTSATGMSILTSSLVGLAVGAVGASIDYIANRIINSPKRIAAKAAKEQAKNQKRQALGKKKRQSMLSTLHEKTQFDKVDMSSLKNSIMENMDKILAGDFDLILGGDNKLREGFASLSIGDKHKLLNILENIRQANSSLHQLSTLSDDVKHWEKTASASEEKDDDTTRKTTKTVTPPVVVKTDATYDMNDDDNEIDDIYDSDYYYSEGENTDLNNDNTKSTNNGNRNSGRR